MVACSGVTLKGTTTITTNEYVNIHVYILKTLNTIFIHHQD